MIVQVPRFNRLGFEDPDGRFVKYDHYRDLEERANHIIRELNEEIRRLQEKKNVGS